MTRTGRLNLNGYAAWLLPGLVGSGVMHMLYRPLTDWPFLTAMLVVGGGAVLLDLARGTSSTALVRGTYLAAGALLLALALIGICNGALDKAPGQDVATTLILKSRSSRSRSHYTLTVTSWLPGESRENLSVSADVYNKAAAGDTVIVHLHPGHFGVPWYGGVSLH